MRASVVSLLLLAACTAKDGGETGPDTTPPEIVLVSPSEGDVLSGVTTLSSDASDDSGEVSVAYLVNGAALGTADAPPYELAWDSATELDGSYFFTAVATDPSGNEARAEVGAWVENEGGLGHDAVQIVSPSDGATLCGDVTVEAVASVDVTEMSFRLDGAPVGSDTTSPFQWAWGTTSAADGPHVLQAVATGAGGAQGEGAVRVTVKNGGATCDDLPSVTFVSPTGAATVSGTIAAEVAASDDAGVVQVRFFVDGGLLFDDTTVPYATDLDTDSFSEGAHTLSAVATDTAGQTAEARLTLTVDRTPPVITLLTPTDGDALAGTVAFSADAADNLGIETVVFGVDGAVVATATAEPWGVDLDTSLLAYGAHTLSVVATDGAGNTATDQVDVRVDNPPVVTLTAPGDGDVLSGLTTVTAEASDDGGVAQVALRVDGTTVGALLAAPYAWDWDTCLVAKGTYTLEVSGRDDAGTAATDDVSVDVDQPLEVELAGPSGTLAASETLTAWVSDDDGGLAVTFAVDGVAVATGDYTEAAPDCSLTCACDAYAATLDVTTIGEGSHVVTASVANAAGDTASASVAVTVDYDVDGDGHDALAFGGDDCDDADATTTSSTWYADADGDGYGDDAVATVVCTGPVGYVDVGGDCDDADASKSPGEPEVCNGLDDDCDGSVDPGTAVDATDWYPDADGDGFGDDAGLESACDAPTGFVATGGDCDDADADVLDAPTWYADADADGFGDPTTSAVWCTDPPGYVASATDCDDATVTTFPGAAEDCDGVDDDCDGAVDEDFDADSDGHYDEADCAAVGGDDCDDADPDVSPSAPEACGNDIDDNCDGTAAGCAFWGFQSFVEAGAKLTGENFDDRAGAHVGTGDLDGDGVAEVLVGACNNDGGGLVAGAAYVVATPSGTSSLSAADAILQGASSGDALCRVAAGDLDGDGDDDLVVAAIGEDAGGSGAGAVYLLTAEPTGTSAASAAQAKLTGESSSDNAGTSVAVADVDGDGTDDVIVGAVGDDDVVFNNGAAYVAFGGAFGGTASLATADLKLTGEARSDEVGEGVGAADFDGDGLADVLAGAALGGAADNGILYLVYGGVTGTVSLADADASFTGANASDGVGQAFDAGDLDGDGSLDLVAGAPGTGAGTVYVVYAPTTGAADLATADATLTSASATAYAGYAVRACDTDADGVHELAVGAYAADPGSVATGALYVFTGAPVGTVGLETDATVTIEGESASDEAGFSIACGDVDGDAFPDLVVGALFEDEGSRDAGAAYVVFGGLGL